MTWQGWLALAAAAWLLGPVGPGQGRTGLLAGSGRLGTPAAQRPTRFRAPWRQVALIGSATAVVAVGAVGGPLLGLALGAVVGTGAILGRDVARGRSDTARRRDLLTGVRVLVGELEAGAGAGAALASAAQAAPRVSTAFAAAAAAAARGTDAGAVLIEAGASGGGVTRRDPVGDQDLRTVGLAWQLGDATGSALAEVLGRVAADLTSAEDQRRTVTVALAGPRSSAAVLTGLPLLGIGLGASMGARPTSFLTTDPAGRALCCAGVLLDVAGVLWMRRILRRVQRA